MFYKVLKYSAKVTIEALLKLVDKLFIKKPPLKKIVENVDNAVFFIYLSISYCSWLSSGEITFISASESKCAHL